MKDMEDDDEVMLYDREIDSSNTSGSILIGLKRFDIEASKKLSKEKTMILAVTCLSIGMFTGLLGPTLPFLSSSTIWFIPMKCIGFSAGISLSSYLLTWFNLYCLLGVSCLSVSVGVCLLPFIGDFTFLCFISPILGIALGLIYNGIDLLYNRIWNQSSASSIRWLYLLISLGAILPTLFLLFSVTVVSNDSVLLQTNTTGFTRLPRAVFSEPMLSVNQSTTPTLTTERLTSHTLCFNSSSCSHSNITEVTNTDKFTSSTKTITQTTAITTTSITTVNDTRSEHRVDTKFGSKRSLHLLYFIVALLFFILTIFYFKLEIREKKLDSFSTKNLNPLSLLIIKPHRIVTKFNTQSSLFSDRLSFTLVFLLLFFFFTLSGIESSCNYLTYSLGTRLQFSRRKCLLLQFCYLFGRLLDLSTNYAWFWSNKPTDIVSIKFLILLRLILLFLLSLLHLFHHFYHLLFFSIGFLLASLSNSIISWIERHFCSNEILLRMILSIIIFSESLFPVLFYQMEYFIPMFLSIALCLSMVAFLIILYLNQKWKEDRSYGLISPLVDMESPYQSDNETSNFQ